MEPQVMTIDLVGDENEIEEGKVCEACGKVHEGSCGSSLAEKLAKQLKAK